MAHQAVGTPDSGVSPTAREATCGNRGRSSKKGDGKWLVRVFAGRDSSGKRRYTSKVVQGSKADARKAAAALTQEVNRGIRVDPGKRTLAAFLEGWLETSAKQRVAENTFRDYGKHLRRHVIPGLGSKRLEHVTADHIRGLYQGMADRGLGRTIQYTHSILRQALQGAVTDRLLTWTEPGAHAARSCPSEAHSRQVSYAEWVDARTW